MRQAGGARGWVPSRSAAVEGSRASVRARMLMVAGTGIDPVRDGSATR